MDCKRLLKLALALIIGFSGAAATVHAQQMDPQALTQAQAQSASINKILANLRGQLKQSPDPEGYSQRLSAALYEMNKDQLAKLTQFTNLVEFEKAFGEVRNVANLVKLKAAAVDDSGYVFKPITPCGLVDTRFRNAAKPLIANVPEQFNMWNGVTQGSTTPCSAASIPAGEIGALALTATVVGAVSDGWLIMSPSGEASESSVLNYMPRDAIANSTVLKYTSGFTLKASTNAHALVSLIGVYVKPIPPRLECSQQASDVVRIYPGTTERTVVSPSACMPGYLEVGIGCLTVNGNATVTSFNVANGMCMFRARTDLGPSANYDEVFAFSRCCRVVQD
ncbi:hypothetical protein [Comamonas sp.]|uniref:hypothetical protein n=1 Tax=Comamonas sp. TaxID=34028 RepID=UPI0028B16A3E|nr:hypothetical protein [Comamonas sp.]